jgi:hypothetical protein
MDKRSFLTLLAALPILGFVTSHPVHAAPVVSLPHQPPATLYPTGSKIVVTNHLSNFQKSCSWDLDCSNGATPVAHSHDEDTLGRLRGWLVFAQWQGKHGKQMTFTLYGSAYDTPAHAQAAAADYQAQLTGPHFKLTAFPCPSSLNTVASRPYCARYHDHSAIGGHYFSLAAAQGTREIELLAYANTRYPTLRHLTFAQGEAALAQSTEAAPGS